MPSQIFRPTQHAWVDEANPTTANFDGTNLQVRSESGANRRSYVEFNVSGTIPSDAVVLNAELRVKCTATDGSPTIVTMDAPRVINASWDSSITWNNQPSRDESSTVRTHRVPANGILSMDVTDIVQDHVDGTTTNNGVWWGSTVEDDATGYGWTFFGDGPNILDPFYQPVLAVYWKTVDSLPTDDGTGDRHTFIGDAIDDLDSSAIKGLDFQVIAELDSGDVDITEDVLSGARLRRVLPFIGEKLRPVTSLLTLDNADGSYSPNLESSQFYARRAINKYVTINALVGEQSIEVFRGAITNLSNNPGSGTVDINLEQKPWEGTFRQRIIRTFAVNTVSGGNPADVFYEYIHNWMGVADTDINLATFNDAKTTWTNWGLTIGTASAEDTAEKILNTAMEATLGAIYFDWQGRYALHVWEPTEPADTLLDGYSELEWIDADFSSVANEVYVAYGYGLDNEARYLDEDSRSDWGVRRKNIKNSLLRKGSRAYLAAQLYGYALADPIAKGRCVGGLNLLQHDLGDCIFVNEPEQGVHDKCIVTSIDIDPIDGQVELEFIKAHWTLPRRDFVNDLSWVDTLGVENYAGETDNPMSNPAPSSIEQKQKNDGSVITRLGWTYPDSDTPTDGFVLLAKHGASSSEATTPTLSDFDQWKVINGSTARAGNLDPFPQSDYVTAAVMAFRNLSLQEMLGQVGPNYVYSDIVTSSSSPDWTVVQYSTGVAVVGRTSGVHEGDTTGTHFGDSTGRLFGDSTGRHFGDSTGTHFGDSTGRLYGPVRGNVEGSTGKVLVSSTGQVAFVDTTGTHYGDTTGNTYGVHKGDSTGNVYGDTTGTHFGDSTGRLYGPVRGNVEGSTGKVLVSSTAQVAFVDTTGTHFGDSTGRLYGAVRGDVENDSGTVMIDGTSGIVNGTSVVPGTFNAGWQQNSYQTTGSPLSADYIDDPAGGEITVTSHTVQFPFNTVTYNAGAINGLSNATPYYVYTDDAKLAGGSVTYQATTSWQTIYAGQGRYYVGKVTTPTSGSTGTNDGTEGGGGLAQ